MTEFASCWGILVGSMLVASPVIFFKIKNSTAIEEDLRFSDNTAADVMGATHELDVIEKRETETHIPGDTPHESQEDSSPRA